MERGVHLLVAMMIVIFLAPSPSSSVNNSWKGCPDRCGSLSISYPFGIGPGYWKEPSFEVNCNTSTNPPRATLQAGYMTFDIFAIYASSIYVRKTSVNYAFSVGLPSINVRISRLIAWTLDDTPYSFSDGNWITVISYDDEAYIMCTINANVMCNIECGSICQSKNDSGGILSCPDNDNTAGNGCSRSLIPRGTKNLLVNLTDDRLNERRLFQDGYAFIGETMNSVNKSFCLTELDHNSRRFISDEWLTNNVPRVLLDWRIGAQNCSEAQRNTGYACHANTYCIDLQSDAGYLCNCSKGYVGNPYLESGCHVCTNTLGGYACSCRKGYSDKGKGCIRNSQPQVIGVLIGLGGAVGLILVLLAICYFFWKKRLKKHRMNQKQYEHCDQLSKHEVTTKRFNMKEMVKATDNFNTEQIIGKGGQGTVYKGMMSDGMVVAVKKLNRVDKKDVDRLINEIVILSQINHRNVVKMVGCCVATDTPMIVYEYVINGSLSHHLHELQSSLTWKARLTIAIDIASAIDYLHTGSSNPIYHRDIKSSNILLDKNFTVKVSDFGISRIVDVDQTHTITTKAVGTAGYVDPESIFIGRLTDKCDVYSFGVVLAEILTGEMPIVWEGDNENRLAVRFLAAMDTDDLDSMLDAQVSREATKEDIIAVAKIAQRCLSYEGKMRPTMKEVAGELKKINHTRVVPSTDEPSTSTATNDYDKENVMVNLCEISELGSSLDEY